MHGLAAPSHNSPRSLRSLCSNTCDELEHEAREYAGVHEPCASRGRKGALPATRPRLCRGSVPLVAGTARCRDAPSDTKSDSFMSRRPRTVQWNH